MVRYHLNPKTGNPGICRADPTKPNSRGCRFKRSEDEHYATMEEAQAAYEASQSEQLIEEPAARTIPAKGSPESRRDEDGWLKEEFAQLVKPQGASCPHCGRAANYLAARNIISNEWAECPCGETYDSDTVAIAIEPGHPSYRFFSDKESVKGAVWYHATDRGDWAEAIGGDIFEAHVGTESAAFDRAITEYVPHSPWARADFYLYEVEIDESATVADEVARDENSTRIVGDGADVARYLNIWEDMASISLAAKSNRLRVLRRRTVSRDEAHERISAYNIREEEEDGEDYSF